VALERTSDPGVLAPAQEQQVVAAQLSLPVRPESVEERVQYLDLAGGQILPAGVVADPAPERRLPIHEPVAERIVRPDLGPRMLFGIGRDERGCSIAEAGREVRLRPDGRLDERGKREDPG